MQERIWGRRLLVWYFGNVDFEATGTPKGGIFPTNSYMLAGGFQGRDKG